MKRENVFSFCLLILIISSASALFEDQIGKFDWSAKHLGCFHETFFDVTESGEEILIVSSERNTVGRINTNTGDLEWRQINEENFAYNPNIVVKGSKVLAVLNNGEYFRLFDANSGILKWQHSFDHNSTTKVKFSFNGRFLAVLSDSKVYGLLSKDKASLVWTTNLDDDSNWLNVVVTDDNVIVVGVLKNNKELRVLRICLKTGGIEKFSRLLITEPSFSSNLCVLSGNFLVCPVGNTIFTVDISSSIELKRVNYDVNVPIIELHTFSSSASSFFLIQSSESTLLFNILENGKAKQLLKLDRSNVFTFAKNSLQNIDVDPNDDSTQNDNTYTFAIYYEAQRLLRIFDLSTQQPVVNLRISSNTGINLGSAANNEAPVKKIYLASSVGPGIYQVLTTRRDCRVDFYEAHVTSVDESTKQIATVDATFEWAHFEALVLISSVEMIDLPLSEAQARIETEFGAVDEPLWKSFFLRVSSQLEQLQRSFVALSDRFAESLSLISSKHGGASLSLVLRHFFGYDGRRYRRNRSATISIKDDYPNVGNLERDYFNLRKLIIVSTLSGSLYGLNNDNGEVIWSLYLGSDALPFRNQLDEPTIPLFIQRGTTLFQYASQAAVIINLNNSKKSSVVIFNPVTGAHIKTFQIDGLKRAELLPFTNDEALHPLLLIDNKEMVHIYPELPPSYSLPYPIYVMFAEKNGQIRGTYVDLEMKKLVEVWRSKLGLFSEQEKIIQIVAKPINQKVHSQGKVLGNRSVLYKYANPNLIAIATSDEAHSSLGIWLIDGVSGQIVYSARHPRSLPPIHLVHCENWIVYTYWNDKARRTELGIIELYEGLEQTNEKHFNSLTTLKHPLTVFAQSYVFSQGVSAIASSETEQGLSTRSLVIAMPFGGVLEISRRFIDARRPLEMTMDLREEMVIPYMPELPVATEDLINYNQTVHGVRGIKTASSGLESTSLVFVYGLDLFYTRVTPSGTFDILKDDFDYMLISFVMIVLIVASFLSKRLWRHHNLKQSWS